MIIDLDSDEPWKQRAVCQLENWPDYIFFERRHEQTALNICGRCPVRRDCLEYQLAWEADAPRAYRHGIFGGKTPSERAELVASRPPKARWARHYCDRCGVPWEARTAVTSGLCAACGGREVA